MNHYKFSRINENKKWNIENWVISWKLFSTYFFFFFNITYHTLYSVFKDKYRVLEGLNVVINHPCSRFFWYPTNEGGIATIPRSNPVIPIVIFITEEHTLFDRVNQVHYREISFSVVVRRKEYLIPFPIIIDSSYHRSIHHHHDDIHKKNWPLERDDFQSPFVTFWTNDIDSRLRQKEPCLFKKFHGFVALRLDQQL